jgi:polyketide biosynthesis enoyl-CoA hydratase PksH
MGVLNEIAVYETIKVKIKDDICFIQIHRPDANNTINDCLIEEFRQVVEQCEQTIKIIVIEGLPEVFCFGADFKGIQTSFDNDVQNQDPEPLYDLWLKLANGPYLTIAHVRGKVNAGGIGFVAACDIVLCEEKSVFSLSELLFGLMPACVLPFLTRRMGFSKSNYMTLMTQPISAKKAQNWGLVDAYEEKSENLLRKHLLRFRLLSKTAIADYKRYMSQLDDGLITSKSKALKANQEVFSNKNNLEMITRYVKTGLFPWE